MIVEDTGRVGPRVLPIPTRVHLFPHRRAQGLELVVLVHDVRRRELRVELSLSGDLQVRARPLCQVVLLVREVAERPGVPAHGTSRGCKVQVPASQD